MGIYEWLRKSGIWERKRVASRKIEKLPPRIEQRDTTPDELSLGFSCEEDRDGNEVWKMKGVPQSDRLAHFYIIGASGTGKTKFLEHLIQQDIKNGSGFGIIDPHGDLVERAKGILAFFAGTDREVLKERVVLIDPTDKESTVCFNPLELTEGYDPVRQAKELVEVFKRIWRDAWGDRMADIFRNTLIILIENGLTLDEVPRFLTNAPFRTKLVQNAKNEKAREYFLNEFNVLNAKTRSEWITSTLNKVRTFLADGAMRDIFLSPKSSFNFREVMDGGKVLLARLPKGLLGDENSGLLGSLILSKIQMAAFSRADRPEEKRKPFYLYIDEFQNFATENFVNILDESRKYKLALTLAHQNLGQIPTELKSSILNCSLQAYFRVSRIDAEVLAKEMFVGITAEPKSWEAYFQELQILPPRTCYIKNKNGGGIALITVPPSDWIDEGFKEVIKDENKILFIKRFNKVQEESIGESYLRKREDIRKEYRERMAALVATSEPDDFREEDKDVNYEEIIKKGENDRVEFKMSIRKGYDDGRGVIKPPEYIISKAISSLMNSEGGMLFIGVHDLGEILGIEADYATVKHRNRDGFFLQLTNIINTHIGREFHHYTNAKIVPIKGRDICIVDVMKSNTPVYLKSAGKEEFYVRSSASSQLMSTRETIEYINAHFKVGF